MEKSLRILVLEDSADDAELIFLALRSSGITLSWERVETAAALRAALAAGPWDAVLSDYSLPEFGATAALAIVRDFDAHLPFMVVSGTVGEEIAAAMMRVGANDYILKENLARLGPALNREVRETENRRARHAAEKALRETEARYRTLFEYAPDGILTADAEGRYLDANASMCRMLGFSREEFIGLSARDIVIPDQMPRIASALLSIKANSDYYREWQFRRKDGTTFPAEVIATAMPDGNLLAMIRDISQRKLGEARLHAQHEVVSILSEAADFAEAAPKLLRAICESTAWEVGDLWIRDHEAEVLRFVDLWHSDSVNIEDFREFARRTTFDIGVCFPGQIWSAGKPGWIVDITKDLNFQRAEVAAHAGLHGGFGFPIVFAGEVLGVAEFFSRDCRPPDADLIRSCESLGSQIGQFIERKRSEEIVHASEERFRAFMDHTPAAAFIKDEGGRFLYVNPVWRQQFDPPPSDWAGKTDSDYWPQDTADLFRASDRECLELNAAIQREESALGANGAEMTWLVMKFPLGDAGQRRIGGMAWDISDRKRAGEKLLLLNRAVDAATQGILIADMRLPDWPIIYASPGFGRMTGYTPAETLNRNCRFLQGAETDRAAVEQIRTAIHQERACNVVLRNYRKDGTPFWNELSLSPVKDPAGKLTHFVGVQTDVTAQRQLEEQFRQAQKMEAVGQLAGGVAHDFNNLLTIINGYSEILIESHAESDPTRAMLQEIHKAGARSAGLTRQLLAFSRQQMLNPKVLDLNEVIGEAQKMLSRLIGEDIDLRIELAPRLDAVTADPGQIEQVLMNLLVNARDAMPQGGRLAIETTNVELGEDYCRTHPEAKPGQYAMLAVADTGCGMTEAVRRRLFEPFFTTKGKDKGTGLGLAVVHGIVKQSNGTIDVESELGVGTTFKIYLPRAEKPAVPGGSRLALGPAPHGSETILLVEDEEAVRVLTLRMLRQSGYIMLEATNGHEALRVAKKFAKPIHLLMTDVVMPGMGGPELAGKMLAHDPTLKVLYLSGYTDDAMIRQGIQQDRVNFLQKPFSPLAMAHKVREVLSAT